MQSNCPPLQIQTSEITARMLLATHEYKLVKRGIVHVKGKGMSNTILYKLLNIFVFLCR